MFCLKKRDGTVDTAKGFFWMQGVRIAEAKARRTLTWDDPIAKAFGLVLALAALSFFIIRNVHGWTFLPFGDEAAHLLGALALHSGDRLYRSYVDQHGPVIFMVTQFYGVLTGWHDLTYARIVSTAFALVSVLSVAFSPVLTSGLGRLWAAALYLGALASVWILQGLYMDSYHTIAGAFVVGGLGLFVMPAWFGRISSWVCAFTCGFCFTMASFTAYSYAPAVTVLAVSGWLPSFLQAKELQSLGPRRTAGALLIGGVCSAIIVLVWLAVFGDILGFFVYHIIVNQLHVSTYINFTFENFFWSFFPAPSALTAVHLTGLICFFCALVAYLCLVFVFHLYQLSLCMAALLGFVGIALLNARGMVTFQDGTFLMASLAAFALVIAELLSYLSFGSTRLRGCSTAVFLGMVLMFMELADRHALASPSGYTRQQIVAAPRYHYGIKESPLFDKIRRLVKQDTRILVLVYNPELFLSIGRPAMKKYHTYLPWEADYARSPWLGFRRDLCVDLAHQPPPVVYFDNWKVWDTYPPEQFMPCVIRILGERYHRDTEFPDLYIRNDIDHGVVG
jgi:hypothetical protein